MRKRPGRQAARGLAIGFEDPAIGVTALQLDFGVATLKVRHFERSPAFRALPGLKIVAG